MLGELIEVSEFAELAAEAARLGPKDREDFAEAVATNAPLALAMAQGIQELREIGGELNGLDGLGDLDGFFDKIIKAGKSIVEKAAPVVQQVATMVPGVGPGVASLLGPTTPQVAAAAPTVQRVAVAPVPGASQMAAILQQLQKAGRERRLNAAKIARANRRAKSKAKGGSNTALIVGGGVLAAALLLKRK